MTDNGIRDRDTDSSLEVIMLDHQQDYGIHLDGDDEDSDLTIEDEESEFTGRTSALFKIVDPLADEQSNVANVRPITYDSNEEDDNDDDDDDYLASRQLALFEGESDEEIVVASDEEKDIIKAIKEEITNMVMAEMKDELKIFDKPLAIEDSKETDDSKDNLVGVNPKLREEIRKMRKLDRILERKVKQEKEVKRERIILERQLRYELQSLLNEKKQITGDEKKNTEKFLALELPASHNVGICIDDDELADLESCSYSPVFQTQPPEIKKRQINRNGNSQKNKNNSSSDSFRTDPGKMVDGEASLGLNSGISSATSSVANLSNKPPEPPAEARPSKSRRKKVMTGSKMGNRKKNFIKRNIQLATDAQNVVAMTENEKKRLNILLADDIHEAVPEEGACLENSAFQANDGFWLNKEEKHRLEEIDSRLKMLLPANDFESMAGIMPSYHLPGKVLSESDMEKRLEVLMDNDCLGEKVLRGNKEERELKVHLQEIDEQLDQLASMPLALELEGETLKLSAEQLNSLLEDCARTLYSSASNVSDESCSGSTTKAILYEHPPHLDPKTLHQLLADARSSGSQILSDRSLADNRIVAPLPESLEHSAMSHTLANETSRFLQRSLNSPISGKSISPTEASSRQSPDNEAVRIFPGPPSQLSKRRHLKSRSHDPNVASANTSPWKPFLPEIDVSGCLVARPLSSQSRQSSDSQNSQRPASSTNF